MNADEIRNMKVGREMDALIAERVMGWADVSETSEEIALVWYYNWFGRPPKSDPEWNENQFHWWTKDRRTFVPCYSKNITAAWGVLDKVTEPGLRGKDSDVPYATKVMYLWQNEHVWAMNAQEAAEFICRASLLAVSEA